MDWWHQQLIIQSHGSSCHVIRLKLSGLICEAAPLKFWDLKEAEWKQWADGPTGSRVSRWYQEWKWSPWRKWVESADAEGCHGLRAGPATRRALQCGHPPNCTICSSSSHHQKVSHSLGTSAPWGSFEKKPGQKQPFALQLATKPLYWKSRLCHLQLTDTSRFFNTLNNFKLFHV